MHLVDLGSAGRFSAEKMQKVGVFDADHLFCDLYCLEAGQSQKAHVHEDADKVYVVLSGKATFTVDGQRRDVGPSTAVLVPAGSEHGVENAGPDRLTLLVHMAPNPNRSTG